MFEVIWSKGNREGYIYRVYIDEKVVLCGGLSTFRAPANMEWSREAHITSVWVGSLSDLKESLMKIWGKGTFSFIEVVDGAFRDVESFSDIKFNKR